MIENPTPSKDPRVIKVESYMAKPPIAYYSEYISPFDHPNLFNEPTDVTNAATTLKNYSDETPPEVIAQQICDYFGNMICLVYTCTKESGIPRFFRRFKKEE